ncbi:conserved hypothetical protein [Vibrio coralliirubri]|nr:conserved hypothetical protein [Vibrio coralliirubri]
MKQGRTEPYLCKADDGKMYVVKGSNATNEGLVKELIVASLGEKFGLPIPPFQIAWVDDLLVEYNSFDLEAGYCFASLYQPNIQEITYNQLKEVNRQQLRDLFVFDYWIRNNDRNLTEHGGNPNFFKDQSSKDTFVLDHNLSFAPDFEVSDHLSQHVSSDSWGQLELLDRETYTEKFKEALEDIDSIIEAIPNDWLETYTTDTIETEIKVVLNKFLDDAFWEDIS